MTTRLLLLFALAACRPAGGDTDDTDANDTGDPEDPVEPAGLFSDAITTVVLEVDYAPGAQPYAGTQGTRRVWALFEANAEHLLGPGKTLVSPSDLADMEEIPDPGASSYDRDAIVALAAAHRDEHAEGSTATFYALWLDGHYEDASGVRDGVIGVSLGGTSIVAMFAPVIARLGLTSLSRSSGEQAVLVHEFGHAVGLVNNGVPLTSAHHDAAHGAHCTNDACVMYWTYEGVDEVSAFVTQYITAAGDTVLFGDECAADVEALRAAR